MKKRFTISPLEGYTSLPIAAGYLHGVTRQRIYQMGVEEDVFRTIRSIPGAAKRPAAYVVQNSELLSIRMGQCEQCKALTDEERAAVLYCTHTDLDVPASQVTELRRWAAQKAAQEAAQKKARETVTAGT